MTFRTTALSTILALLSGCSSGEQTAAPVPPHAAPARDGFAFASADRGLSFPDDYGSHPEFQTEWWYYTGNVESDGGRHFGYQLTFFRRSLEPPGETAVRDVATAATDIYMGHLALSDSAAGEQRAFERFSRGADLLAGASSHPHSIWLDDWRVETSPDQNRHLVAADGDVSIDLILAPTKGPVPHGVAGYSQKGADPNRASHYYSFPRMRTTGSIAVQGITYQVGGASWMDHEFTSSGLADDQIGWDWFSIQLDDGVDLMLFHLRTADGVDPYSSGSLISDQGAVTRLGRDDFAIEAHGEWTSPRTGARYPAAWRVTIPDRGIDLQLQPRIADQELALSFVYWEGAVAVSGTHDAVPVRGNGYAELTGYARSMKGTF